MTLFLFEREVTNTWLIKEANQVIKVTEVLKFDFTQQKYKLDSMEFQNIKYLEGGENNE